MATVELRVSNEMLPNFEAMRPHIGGREAARREDPYQPGVTIIDMDMDEAPEGAATMELILERVLDKGTRIVSTTYYDAQGVQLSIIERYGNGGWLQVGWAEVTNDSGQPERVEPAP